MCHIHGWIPNTSCSEEVGDRVKGHDTKGGTDRKMILPGTVVSVVLMGFNERFVPDRGPVCFSTLAEPWAEDRCNFLIIFIEFAVT